MARHERKLDRRAPPSSARGSSFPVTFPGLILATTVAEDLHVTVQTLRNWARRGEFPKAVRFAGRSYYRQRDINACLATLFGLEEGPYPRQERAS